MSNTAIGSFREMYVTLSVTRFGEISPLLQNCKSLWLFIEGLLSFLQDFEPTLCNF